MPPLTDRQAHLARLGPAAAAVAAFGLHALGWDRYGVFRDELYFIACGQRLSWGFVDQPPGIAVVAGLAHAVFGTWVPGLRLLPWLAHALLAWLASRLALRLGGGGFAAILAAVAVATSPLLLGLGHLLTMNAFEPVLVLGTVLVIVGLADGGAGGRRWLLAGGLAAAAVLFKYSAAMLAVCLAAGLAVTPARRALASRWAVAGAALALALVLPNLLWQAAHGFPFLELVANGIRYKNAPVTPASFAGALLLEGGGLHAVAWVGGLGWLLFGAAGRRHRWLGLGSLAYLALLLATKGKAYYFGAALPALLAAGAVALEARVRGTAGRVAVTAVLATSGLVLLPFAVPVLPVERFVRYQEAIGVRPPRTERHATGVLPQTYADMFGWRELATGVAELARTLPEEERRRAVVFAQNYGEAAALEVFGPQAGLDVPVASGHNQYWLWGVPPGRDTSIIVGDEHEDCERFFEEKVHAVRLPEVPYALPSESGRTLWICRGLKVPIERIWPLNRRYR
jgi:4-amino-4-deoxy-L-arabinose transferase-like glycosyltransferase